MALIDKIDNHIYSYATLRQKEVIDAYRELGVSKAMEKLGCSKQAIYNSIKQAIKRADSNSYPLETDVNNRVQDGFNVKGTTTYYDADGKPKLQWVKATVDQEKRNTIIQEGIKAATEVMPRLKAIPYKGQALEDLLNLYTITDYHIGMLAWDKEGGEDWDIKIAEKVLVGAFSAMISASPKSKIAVVNQLGDFTHFDGILPVTPTSKHVLDADSRFRKMIKVAIRCMRAMIDMALSKHEQVHVICAEGNHDLYGSHWLQEVIINSYENEPRLTVDDTPKPFYCYQHGETMLAFTHGHLKRGDDLPSLFAADFPKIWGDTKYRYAHEGHMHHKQVKEMRGMTREMHQTLAARDSHSSRGGYHSERACNAITYSKNHGEVSRVTIKPEMIV